MVGPFIFYDHMGPAAMAVGEGIDVRPHPHISLATVTYLFEGEIVHRDSLGSFQPIRPGDVNWMLAGRGIVHSERSSPEERRRGVRLHGIQSWVALPRAHEEDPPRFEHHPARLAAGRAPRRGDAGGHRRHGLRRALPGAGALPHALRRRCSSSRALASRSTPPIPSGRCTWWRARCAATDSRSLRG